jgi:hypothetical protein
MPRFYSNPRRAASPARIIQTTRAMATVSRNRYMGRGSLLAREEVTAGIGVYLQKRS